MPLTVNVIAAAVLCFLLFRLYCPTFVVNKDDYNYAQQIETSAC